MSDDSTYKFFYGKNYEKALRLRVNEEGHLKENFVKNTLTWISQDLGSRRS